MMNKSVIWSCSITGKNHQKEGIPNQDCRLGCHFSWGDLVVVSDGVGSCENAAIGSKAACIATKKAINECIASGVFDFERIILLLHANWLVGLRDVPPETASSTCLWAFTYQDRIYVASVGDGIIAACGDSADRTLVLAEDKQDSFCNITDSLKPSSADSTWKTAILERSQYRGLLLCTDGVSEDYAPSKQPQFACAVLEQFSMLPSRIRRRKIVNLLKTKHAPGHFDDKTMICIWWGDENGVV